MDDKTIQAVEAIIKRGNDAEIRRKGDGYVVLEVKKDNQIYDSCVIGRRKGQ